MRECRLAYINASLLPRQIRRYVNMLIRKYVDTMIRRYEIYWLAPLEIGRICAHAHSYNPLQIHPPFSSFRHLLDKILARVSLTGQLQLTLDSRLPTPNLSLILYPTVRYIIF